MENIQISETRLLFGCLVPRGGIICSLQSSGGDQRVCWPCYACAFQQLARWLALAAVRSVMPTRCQDDPHFFFLGMRGSSKDHFK